MLNMHISRYVTLHRSLGRKYSEQDLRGDNYDGRLSGNYDGR